MKTFALISLLSLFTVTLHAQDIFSTNTGKASFFSETPVANIDAHSTTLRAAINVATKKIYCTVPMKSFKFQKALMQEHFNENYVESDKYPNAIFSGIINEAFDVKKDGVYNVTVTGKLTVHGVAKDRNIAGTITVKNGIPTIHTEFIVKVVDHDIEIPTIVITEVAEEIKVTIDAELPPHTD